MMRNAMLRMMIDDDELKARFASLIEIMGDNYDPRDSAVELVRSRGILPAEADRLAVLFKWYPFTVNPTGRKYDPMEAVYWTPAMVLSWIANRSIAPEMGPEWRRDAYRWRDIPRFGWDVVGYEPLTLNGFRQEAILRAAAGGAWDEPEKLDLAMEELWSACRRGELGISAHDPSTGIRRAPTRLEWQDMDFAEDGNRDVLRSPIGLWSSPTAEAEVVMKLWPALHAEALASDDEPEIAEDETADVPAETGGGDENLPDSVVSDRSALSLHEAELFLSTEAPPEPRDEARRFTDARNGKRLSEARDLCAQILIRHFEHRLGGAGRKPALRENAVSDWYAARRKQKGSAPITEPGEFKSLVRHTDDAFFKLLK